MTTNERRQLHDEIVDGTRKIEDCSMAQLKDFRGDFDMDYNPKEPFFAMVGREIERRNRVPARKKVKINRNFF